MAYEHIWANQAIWFGKELTPWTAVSATHWIPKMSGSLNPETTYTNDESGIWTIVTVRDSRKTKNGSKLEIEWILWDVNVWLLLLWVFWDVTSSLNSDVSWLVYDHEYSIAESNTHPSFTVISNDNVMSATNQSEQATYMMIDSFEINATAWDYAKLKMNMIGRGIYEVAKQNTAFVEETKFSFDDVEIKVVTATDKASALTAFNSATAFKVKTLRVAFNKNLMQNQELGNIDIANIFNQNFTIEGDFEAIYRDRDVFDVFNDSLKKYLKITIKNVNKVIWTAENPTIEIILNKVSFQEWSRSTDINTIITQTIGFVWEYNTVDNEAATAKLTNTVATY